MTKKEYMAMSLPYGLKFKSHLGTIFNLSYFTTYNGKGIGNRPISAAIEDGNFPICRPLSYLTKEIVQEDYNEGKPFIALNQIKEEIFGNMCDLYRDWIEVVGQTDNTKEIIERMVIAAPFEIVQYLLKWHFAVGLKENEFVPVTEEFNPYK